MVTIKMVILFKDLQKENLPVKPNQNKTGSRCVPKYWVDLFESWSILVIQKGIGFWPMFLVI